MFEALVALPAIGLMLLFVELALGVIVPCLPTLAAGLTAAGILIASAGAWWTVIPVTFAVLLGAAQQTFFAAMIRLDAARRLREAIAETHRSR